ncbi:EAL domain-containing protein [Saccharibacillus sp. CPCC 101409]|uniref:EAL domain-containing protein n=1 Tax=Saccharibacillus sp. CPCC 101409 TaxID=3058041 RepID=UPI00267293B3|nr:EAL domain-containing protein [Saccharibacillus sp. CPCC 101409]MDO3411316.1 EAL domain-containing protein [Saccharibacillus sp. CPCC 101409]
MNHICSTCMPVRPIEDWGTVYLRPIGQMLGRLIEEQGWACGREQGNKNSLFFSYTSKEQFLDMAEWLNSLPVEWTDALEVKIAGENSRPELLPWLPFTQLAARFQHMDMVGIITRERFTSFLQPIVDHGENIVAYEFLLRPAPGEASFNPFELFDVARRTGMHSFLDRSARISAIRRSSEVLPKGIKRFINFLPSSIYNPEYCLTHTFAAIQRYDLDPQDFVFEVVETEKINDMAHLQRIFNVYRSRGISVALDDVGSGYSTPELLSLLKPDYVKIDRGLIDRCDESPEKQRKIREIVERSEEFGGRVLAEGIERRGEYEYCLSSGIPLAQGYLFGRPQAEPAAAGPVGHQAL